MLSVRPWWRAITLEVTLWSQNVSRWKWTGKLRSEEMWSIGNVDVHQPCSDAKALQSNVEAAWKSISISSDLEVPTLKEHSHSCCALCCFAPMRDLQLQLATAKVPMRGPQCIILAPCSMLLDITLCSMSLDYAIYVYIYTCILCTEHVVTLYHCISFHYFASHYNALLCVAVPCITVHYISFHFITLHCIYIALHCIALHCLTLHYITLQYITLR